MTFMLLHGKNPLEAQCFYDVMEAFYLILCWYCMLNAFKTVDLILTRGVFVNLAQNKQHVDTGSLTLFV